MNTVIINIPRGCVAVADHHQWLAENNLEPAKEFVNIPGNYYTRVAIPQDLELAWRLRFGIYE